MLLPFQPGENEMKSAGDKQTTTKGFLAVFIFKEL
jgi:hypothetical protein